MTRARGLAPNFGSYPLSATQSSASASSSIVTLRSANCPSSSIMNLSTTRCTTSGGSDEKPITASSRFRNSGENMRLIASSSSPTRSSRANPMAGFAISAAPALVVMMRITLRKSTDLPLWSVSLPWSITCSSTLKRSGWAFSISSSSRTECGCWSIASVSRPP